MEDKKVQLHFIECPKCNGKGFSEDNKICPECLGMGMGFFYRNKFLYWGLHLNKTIIKIRKLNRVINKIIDYLSVVVGIGGLFSLGYWFFLELETFHSWSDIKKLAFWEYKSIWILFFWFSLLIDLFLIFRFTENESHKKKIKKNVFKAKSNIVDNLPDNWKQLRKKAPKLDVANSFGITALKYIENAYELARKTGVEEVDAKFLFLSILDDQKIKGFFSRLDVNLPDLYQKIEKLVRKEFEKGKFGINKKKFEKRKLVIFSPKLKEMLIRAYLNAYLWEQDRVNVLNILSSIALKDEDIKEVLYDLKVEEDNIINVIHWFKINELMIESYRQYRKEARFKPANAMNRAYTSIATPVLNAFSYDLTMAAKWGRLEFCVSREKEIESIFQSLTSGEVGVALVGNVGVGKRAIINGIAQRMVKEDVPKMLKDKRLLELDIAKILSGATVSDAEQRLVVILQEVQRAGNIILFIDNIENLVGITTGTEESLDLSEVLANAIERKNIICFVNCSTTNYTKYIEGISLDNVLNKIEIKEPEINQAIQIIQSKIGFWEYKYKIFFSYNAIEEAVILSSKYLHDEYLPEKAIKILERVAVQVDQRCESKDRCVVSREDVVNIISEITNIPLNEVSQTEGQKLLTLEDKIHERMIDQEEAVKMVANSLRRARAEVRENKKPIASFLFLGPTGVGKTELAKTLSEVYFGDEKNMIRVDMSEYQQVDSVVKMIGDAKNFGYLTEAVRKKPFSLVLLDEFEKAHSDILNLFLQVMDDGRLTDGKGRTIDFTNTIIIATSNAGALYIQEQIKNKMDILDIKKHLIEEHLNKVMRPELINRFDGLIVFKPLSEDDVRQIAILILNQIGNRLEKKGVKLEFSNKAVSKFAHEGYDPKFGARPLKRLLQDKIENEIANKILNNEIKRRDTIYINDFGEVEIKKGREL